MLKSFIENSGQDRAAWADRFDIGLPFLSQLINGAKRPSLDLAFRIERETSGAVPASSWANSEAAA